MTDADENAAASTSAGWVTRFRVLAHRPRAVLFVLLLGVYAYFYQAGGWNQNSRFDMVRAVVEQGTFVIDRHQHNTGDDSLRNGHYYSDKAPGASWLCIPTYFTLFNLAAKPRPAPAEWLAWAVWFSIVIAISVPSAAAATFLARLGERLGLSPPLACLVALGWGLATLGLPYSTLLYGNQLSGSLLLIAFTLLVEIRQGEVAKPKRIFMVGALLGYAAASEYPAVLIGLPIAAYGSYVLGLRRARFLVLGGLVPMLALFGYHWRLFGSPFAFPYDYSVWETHHTGWFMGLGKPSAEALRGILTPPYRGLLHVNPWLVAALPGAIFLGRKHLPEVLVCIASVLAFLWLNSSVSAWDGGWAPGPRYLVPMLPFLSLLGGGVFLWILPKPNDRVPLLSVRLAAILLLAMLGLRSVTNMFAATAVKPEIPTHYTKPYEEFVWPSFHAGKLAVSTQSIDMIDNPPGAPRQAWNLGMKLGLDGKASLFPLYLWLACLLGWLGRVLYVAKRSDVAPAPAS